MKKRDDNANLSCSFCGKSQKEVKKLIAGPTAGQGVDAKLMHDMANAQGWRPAVAAEVVDRKALDHLVQSANVSDVDPPEVD